MRLILLIFRYCFSIANLGEKFFWIECCLPTLLHEDPSSGETRTKSGNNIVLPTPKKSGIRLGDLARPQAGGAPGRTSRGLVGAFLIAIHFGLLELGYGIACAMMKIMR
jgi:hypothetical protein